ncbi:porin [Caballeronia sp. DA-9]|uniref:porin n=1 Tax=Caballeronia sp. DA-9 TaxID=3436237 RepID=UPI003F661E80
MSVLGSWSQTYTEPDRFRYMTFGGSYTLSPLVVMVRSNTKELGNAKFINFGFGGTYKIGFGSRRTEVTFNRGRGSESAHQPNMYALGYSYNLSKRTTLYGQVVYLDNMGKQASVIQRPRGRTRHGHLWRPAGNYSPVLVSTSAPVRDTTGAESPGAESPRDDFRCYGHLMR